MTMPQTRLFRQVLVFLNACTTKTAPDKLGIGKRLKDVHAFLTCKRLKPCRLDRDHVFTEGPHKSYRGITKWLSRVLWPGSRRNKGTGGDGLTPHQARKRGMRVETECSAVFTAKTQKESNACAERAGELAQSVMRRLDELGVIVTHVQPVVCCAFTRHATAIDFMGIEKGTGRLVVLELKTTSGDARVGTGHMQPPLDMVRNCPLNQHICQLAWAMDIIRAQYYVDASHMIGHVIRVNNDGVFHTTVRTAFLDMWAERVVPMLIANARRVAPPAPATKRRGRSKSKMSKRKRRASTQRLAVCAPKPGSGFGVAVKGANTRRTTM